MQYVFPNLLLSTAGYTLYKSSDSLAHSVDRLTGDGSLRPPDVAITGHVPCSICSKLDIDLQLADPSLLGTTSWTCPLRSVIRSVTGTAVDSQTNCKLCKGTDPCRQRTCPNTEILYVCHGFCYRCFAAEYGSSLMRLAQSRIPRIRRKHVI